MIRCEHEGACAARGDRAHAAVAAAVAPDRCVRCCLLGLPLSLVASVAHTASLSVTISVLSLRLGHTIEANAATGAQRMLARRRAREPCPILPHFRTCTAHSARMKGSSASQCRLSPLFAACARRRCSPAADGSATASSSATSCSACDGGGNRAGGGCASSRMPCRPSADSNSDAVMVLMRGAGEERQRRSLVERFRTTCTKTQTEREKGKQHADQTEQHITRCRIDVCAFELSQPGRLMAPYQSSSN